MSGTANPVQPAHDHPIGLRGLLCIPSMAGGGAERQLAYLAAELTRGRVETHVAIGRGGTNLERLQQSGATIHFLQPSSNYSPLNLVRLLKIARKSKAQFIQTYLTQMDVLGGLCAKLLRIPWILTERSSASPYRIDSYNGAHFKLRSYTEVFRLRLGKRADAIIANSTGGLKYWQEQGCSSRLHLIPNGIVVDLDKSATVAEAVLKRIGFPEKEPFILAVGRFDEGKNHLGLIEALAELAEKVRVRAIICGAGPLLETLRKHINNRGLDAWAFLPGYIEGVTALMERAALFVSASHYEGCPNAVLEAMTVGCPLVVSDIPAHREILDQRAALFVDPKNSREIAHAITSAISDPDSTRDRLEYAKKKAQSFSVTAMADRYLAVYRQFVPSAFLADASCPELGVPGTLSPRSSM